jgi:hypothetical protein
VTAYPPPKSACRLPSGPVWGTVVGDKSPTRLVVGSNAAKRKPQSRVAKIKRKKGAVSSLSTEPTGTRRILISGVPAAGKSHFRKWVMRELQWSTMQADANPTLTAELGRINLLLGAGSLREATEACRKMIASFLAEGQDGMIEYEFPPACLPTVKLLRDAGFALWWFDADWDVARTAHLAAHADRADRAAAEFDLLRNRVIAAWDQIRGEFEPNILTTLATDGTRMPPVEIARRMGIVPADEIEGAYEGEMPE